jgi:hypothetical protein
MTLLNPVTRETYTVSQDVPSAFARRALSQIEEIRVDSIAQLEVEYAAIYEMQNLDRKERRARMEADKSLATQSVAYGHKLQEINDLALISTARASVVLETLDAEVRELVETPASGPFWQRQNLAELEVYAVRFRDANYGGRQADPVVKNVASAVPPSDETANGTEGENASAV